ncbi:MAG: GTPase ObgE [Candidatus Glassbacteria bacterium]
MFVDRAVIKVRAGEGGKGLIAFRREAHNSRGGPSGGRGGSGGSVYFEADEGMHTLMDFRYHHEYSAERGAHGGPNDRTGANGPDVVIRVPAGTLLTDADTGEVIGDLTGHGQRALAAGGGRGGRGNASFATSTRQSPDFAQDGEPGQERNVQLELKLLADVGLVGFPNAGKSTLLARLTKARPKIADYPFTTLTPNLGVVTVGMRSFVMADIPGLIEGAHEGKGLGHEFLRHIERTKVLVFLIDVTSGDPQKQYDTLCGELESYSRELALRPRCAVFSKLDLLPPTAGLPALQADSAFLVTGVSAVSGVGLETLVHGLADRVRQERAAPPAEHSG